MAKRTITRLFIPTARIRLFRRRKSRAPSLITAIDVDGQTLRVVQASPRGRHIAMHRVVSAPLELPPNTAHDDPVVIGRAIARALEQLRLKPGTVVMGVSRAQVVLRTLTLPLVNDIRQLASMVHLQLGRDLPFRMDEAVIDFKVGREIPATPPKAEAGSTEGASGTEPKQEPGSARLEVLVAAVKRDVVESYQQIAQAAGLKLAALGLRSYANARCLDACHVVEDDQAVALVSLRPDGVNIDVIAQQALLFSRGASVKPNQEPAPTAEAPSAKKGDLPVPDAATAPESPKVPDFCEAAVIEVVRSLHGYSGMEPQKPVTAAVVVGATGYEATVIEALGSRLSIPCGLLDLTAALGLPRDSAEETSAAIAPIGLALGFGDPVGLPFDFLKPKRPAVQRDMRRIRLLAAAAAIAVIFTGAMMVRTALVKRHEKARLLLADELAAAEKQSPILRRTIRQATVVEEWAGGGRNWLDHLGYLSAILPPADEVYATSFAVGGVNSIRMNVQARSGEILAKFEKQLRGAGYDVKPLAITPGADRNGYEFRSSVEIVVPDRMKIDPAKWKIPARPADDGSLDPAPKRKRSGR